MEIAALFVTIMIGLSAVFLSLENDSLRKYFTETKKAEEDRLYKLDVIKDLEEKIAYTTDPEKVVDEVELIMLLKYSEQ